jgi:hypothetical protein
MLKTTGWSLFWRFHRLDHRRRPVLRVLQRRRRLEAGGASGRLEDRGQTLPRTSTRHHLRLSHGSQRLRMEVKTHFSCGKKSS